MTSSAGGEPEHLAGEAGREDRRLSRKDLVCHAREQVTGTVRTGGPSTDGDIMRFAFSPITHALKVYWSRD